LWTIWYRVDLAYYILDILVITKFTTTKAEWPEQAALLKKIRKTVFVIEQGVSSEIEWDGRDHLCQHVIAYSMNNDAIGTGRMLPNGHIGRIAVLAAWRGKGVGGAILKSLIELARETENNKVYLNSQTRAIDFYRKFSFKPQGQVFMEAGIPHQTMSLKL